MTLSKEFFVDLEEKFMKVKKLIDESLSDPETAPYTSKYAAKQHLESMNSLLDSILAQNNTNFKMCNKIIGMLGAIQLQLGNIALDTEELSQGEKHYQECLQIIESHKYEKEVASVTFNLYNQLGILWSRRDNVKAMVYLHIAESFYKELKEKHLVPIYYMDLFHTQYQFDIEDATTKHEQVYTHTLYYLAQVYMQKNAMKSSIYCHQTLQRLYDTNSYEYIDWILNSATLSQVFMQHNGFKQARHHLCASLFMLDKYKIYLNENMCEGEEYEAKMETMRERSADVARCWIKYCVNLLSNSKDRLVNTENVDETPSNCTDLGKMVLDESMTVSAKEFEELEFKNIDLSTYESQITDQFALTIDDAKKIYIYALKWITAAVDYHTLNTHASDYIEITLDHTQFYDLLAFFEEDSEIQCKMYNRAINLLEQVVEAVNPTYYMKECRDMWFRIGTFSSDILDNKTEDMRRVNPKPTPEQIESFNALIDKSVFYLTKFIDSFKNSSGGYPTKVPEYIEKYYLQAYLLLATTQARYCTSDGGELRERVQKSIDAYETLLAYCKANEKARDLIVGGLEIADIMVPLLKLKITRL